MYLDSIIKKVKKTIDMANIYKNAEGEQSCSIFPDPEKNLKGEPEKLLLKRHHRRTETILNEMVDNLRKYYFKEENSIKKHKRKRKRGVRVYVYNSNNQ